MASLEGAMGSSPLRRLASLPFALLLLATAAHAQTTPTSIQLTWTAPGDDGMIGTAAQYDLRYSTSAITAANFGSATRFTSTPTPGAPGTSQTVTVTGLTANTTYYFALKTADEIPNWSAISNVTTKATPPAPDLTRPAPIALNTTTVTDTTVTLSWVAVGDDSLTGTATTYDIRYSTSAITAANFASATQAPNEPVPTASGTAQTYIVRSLTRQTPYYFAIRVSDEAGNQSAMSNVPNVTTLDTMPPAAITNLTANFLWLTWRAQDALKPSTVGAPKR
jgi:chitodextrinase